MRSESWVTKFFKSFIILSLSFSALFATGANAEILPSPVKSMVNQAEEEYQEGNYDSALRYYNQSLNRLSPRKQNLSYVIVGNKKLFFLLEHPKILVYKPFSKKLLKTSRSLKQSEPIHYVRTLRLIAQTYLDNRRNVAKSRELLKKALNVHKDKVKKHFKELAYIYNYLGLAANFETNYTKSNSYLKQALELINEKGLKKQYVSALNKRYTAHLVKKQGNRDSALGLYLEGFEIVKKDYSSGHPKFHSFNNDIGVTFRKLSKYDSALSYSFKALKILKQNDLSNSIKGGLIKKSIGSHYFHKYNMQRALIYQKRSLSTFQHVDTFQDLNTIGVYNALGIIYRSIRSYDKSEKYLRKGISITEGFENQDKVRYSKGTLYYNLGNTLIAQKAYEKAIQNFKKAIEVYKQIFPDDHQYLHTIKVKLSKAHELIGNLEKSYRIAELEETYYKEKLHNSLYNSFYFQVRGIKANVLRKRKKFDSALQIINNLLIKNAIQYNPKNPRQNPSLNQIANKQLLRNTGLLDIKARTFLDYYQQAKSNQYLIAAFKTYTLLDSIHQQNNQKISLKKSKSYYKRFFGHHFPRAIYTTYHLLKHNIGSKKDQEKYLKKAFYFSENAKCSILMESLAEKAVQYSKSLPDSVKNRLRYYQKKLEGLQSKINTTSDSLEEYKLQSKKISLQSRQKDFFDTIQSHFPKVYDKNFKQSLISLEKLKPILSAQNKNLIEYTHESGALFGMVITDQGTNLVKLPHGDSLNYYVKRIRNNLVNKQKFPAKAAQKIYKSLIEPIEPHLTEENLVIVPEGKMGYLPFELLLKGYKPDQNARNYHYLIKDYAFSYTPSASLWAMRDQSEKEQPKHPYLGFAPSFDQERPINEVDLLNKSRKKDYLRELPNAKKEILQSTEYWNGDVYIGQKASEQLFKKKAQSSSIIHLATHGYIDDQNPAYNRLYFNRRPESEEDGILYTYELYDMNLTSELAVLSACNTGVGKIRKGSGIMSLAKGFKIAGCENILMTLWSVNDRAGSDLIDEFYSNLNMGYSKEKALRKAKLDYIKENDPANANPYFWAGFVLMGSGKAVRQPGFNYNWVFFSVSSSIMLLLIIGLYNIRKGNKPSAYN